jgi:peptide/nickel transport system permease protein
VEPIRVAWWVSFFPGLAILLTVMASIWWAMGYADALDPRPRGAAIRAAG